ncbi:MAG: hypothetical protein LUH00_11930 [Lachnospiraceae bacterium]|nr:hypothetical protein [Lachnospiraceae bacterium]
MFENLTDGQFWAISVVICVLVGAVSAMAYRFFTRWRRSKGFEESLKEYNRRVADGEPLTMEMSVYRYKDKAVWQRVCDQFREEGISIWQTEITEFPDKPEDNFYRVSVYSDGDEKSHALIEKILRENPDGNE